MVEYYGAMKTNGLELHVSTWKTLDYNMKQPCGPEAFMYVSSMSPMVAKSCNREADGLPWLNIS